MKFSHWIIKSLIWAWILCLWETEINFLFCMENKLSFIYLVSPFLVRLLCHCFHMSFLLLSFVFHWFSCLCICQYHCLSYFSFRLKLDMWKDKYPIRRVFHMLHYMYYIYYFLWKNDSPFLILMLFYEK